MSKPLDHKLDLVKEIILTKLQKDKDMLRLADENQRNWYFIALSKELFGLFQKSIPEIHLRPFVTETCIDILKQDWFWMRELSTEPTE